MRTHDVDGWPGNHHHHQRELSVYRVVLHPLMLLHHVPLSELHVGHLHSLNTPSNLLGLNEILYVLLRMPQVNAVTGKVRDGAGILWPQSQTWCACVILLPPQHCIDHNIRMLNQHHLSNVSIFRMVLSFKPLQGWTIGSPMVLRQTMSAHVMLGWLWFDVGWCWFHLLFFNWRRLQELISDPLAKVWHVGGNLERLVAKSNRLLSHSSTSAYQSYSSYRSKRICIACFFVNFSMSPRFMFLGGTSSISMYIHTFHTHSLAYRLPVLGLKWKLYKNTMPVFSLRSQDLLQFTGWRL